MTILAEKKIKKKYKNQLIKVLYTKQYSSKKIKPKKGKGSFKREKKF